MSSVASTSTPLVAFKKGPRSRPQQSRKRSTSPSDSAEPPNYSGSSNPSAVVRPTKKSLLNPLIQGTKRRRDPNEELPGGGLDELDYRADDSLPTSKGDTFATRSSDWDLEQVDANGSGVKPSGLSEKKIKLNEDGEIDDGLYHGSANYLKTINLGPDAIGSKMKTGPIRATANIRTITLVDYQPDVCKDYKETGFCGYGDSCKFLHDRGDYLAGWQLDKLAGESAAVVEEEEEEEVPFACLICRKEFTEPVVTKCGHYFCMECAINRFKKSPKCYACGAATSGIFNKAEKILAKLEAKRDRQREERGWKPDEEEGGDGGIEFGGGSGSDEEGGEGVGDDDEE